MLVFLLINKTKKKVNSKRLFYLHITKQKKNFFFFCFVFRYMKKKLKFCLISFLKKKKRIIKQESLYIFNK